MPDGVEQREAARAEPPGTPELLRALIDQTRELARKELALARAELFDDARAELDTLMGLAGAALLGLLGVNLLLVAGALGLGAAVPAWLAALGLGLGLLLAAAGAGAWGAQRRVRRPLTRTRRTLEEDAEWAKRKIS